MNTTVQNISPTVSLRVNKGYSFLTLSAQLFFGFLFLVVFGLKVEAQTCPTNFTMQPLPQVACVNGSATFTVASDVIPDSYQWYKDGIPTGTNSSTLTINNVTAGNLGSYHVEISKA